MASSEPLCFEAIEIGAELPRLEKGPFTTPHLMRWSAAMENWHKIHYDLPFTIEHEKLPGLLVNGSLKQQFVVQLLKDWVGLNGWVWKVSFQFRAMNLVGETLSVWARVTGKHSGPGYGLVDLDIGIINDKGIESTPGKATVAVPYRGGKPVPYPFVPPDGLSPAANLNAP
jgi:acyl dehydratase